MNDLESSEVLVSIQHIHNNFQEIRLLFYALLIFMTLDYITGVFVATKQKQIDSKVGFIGILKKTFILIIFVMGLTIDTLIIGQGEAVTFVIVSFYLVNEGFSILENAKKMNIPLPQNLIDIIMEIEKQKKI